MEQPPCWHINSQGLCRYSMLDHIALISLQTMSSFTRHKEAIWDSSPHISKQVTARLLVCGQRLRPTQLAQACLQEMVQSQSAEAHLLLLSGDLGADNTQLRRTCLLLTRVGPIRIWRGRVSVGGSRLTSRGTCKLPCPVSTTMMSSTS